MQRTVVDLVVVVPAFNEEASLPILVAELKAALDGARLTYQLLVVDDGSRDGTADVVAQLAAGHPQVLGLRLSRNFGHQAAVSIGLQHAARTAARAVAVMDADLQDTPEDLVAMYRRLQDGADVVYAVRRTRKEHALKRFAYTTFYRVLASVATVPIPLDAGDFCVMSAEFTDRLNALPERLRFVRGLRAWLGGRQIAWPVDRAERRAGVPQYTFRRLVRLALDGVVSFSDAPLRVATVLGLTVASAAFVGVLVVLAWRALGLLPAGAGVATIALSVLFLGGVQLVTIGLLGEYVGRIYDEVKGRPIAVVAEVIGDEGAPAPSGGVEAVLHA